MKKIIILLLVQTALLAVVHAQKQIGIGVYTANTSTFKPSYNLKPLEGLFIDYNLKESHCIRFSAGFIKRDFDPKPVSTIHYFPLSVSYFYNFSKHLFNDPSIRISAGTEIYTRYFINKQNTSNNGFSYWVGYTINAEWLFIEKFALFSQFSYLLDVDNSGLNDGNTIKFGVKYNL